MAGATSPIGVFDSGVGGISVLGEMRRMLPQEDFIYFGDTLHAPYGTKPRQEVMGYVNSVMEKLLSQDVKAVVIACNTATAVAAAELRSELQLPIIGMEPALKPAHEARNGGRILVLATPMTLALPKFQRLMGLYGDGAVPVPCPGLMDLVEQERFEDARAYLRKTFDAYRDTQVDAVVLGCTHYVFLKKMAAELLPGACMMDGNAGTARQLRRVLASHGLLRADGHAGIVTLETSGSRETVLPVMRRLLQMA